MNLRVQIDNEIPMSGNLAPFASLAPRGSTHQKEIRLRYHRIHLQGAPSQIPHPPPSFGQVIVRPSKQEHLDLPQGSHSFVDYNSLPLLNQPDRALNACAIQVVCSPLTLPVPIILQTQRQEIDPTEIPF